MNRNSTQAFSAPVTARGQRTRQKLVDAAEAIFGEKGYEAASIADITRKAEVALGTFYVYFPDKKTLFVEVVDNLGDRLRDELGRAVEGISDRVEVERTGLRAFFRFIQEHRLMYRVVRQAEFVDEACYRRYYQRFAEPYAHRLEAAMDEGLVRRIDPETLAWCLMGIGDFLGMRYVLWRHEKQLERALDAAMDFIEHGIVVGGPAPARKKTPSPRARRAPSRSPKT
ncbi:MAG: TetR/AcrR family transcriptional regulator [Myxococcaceae bacterium]|nr:TetR/AcrR family transcriptional regulator [Myxococcaceae bacterium]MCI0669563.1 TetR/AcrR family transcriptional regulator [Myxococcaceae bacterium]